MKRNNLKKNIIYKVLNQILILIFPVITTPYISRILGVEKLGEYYYYNSIVLYFIYFAMLGIKTYGNRLIAKNKDNKLELNKSFTSVYIIQIISSILVSIFYIIYLFISSNKLLILIMYIHFFISFFELRWVLYGLDDFKSSIYSQIISRLLMIVSIFLFVKTKKDFVIFVFLKSILELFEVVLIFILAKRKVKLVKVSLLDIKEHLVPCIKLFIPILATNMFIQMDKVVLGYFTTKTLVGYYEAANKIIVMSLSVITAILAVLSPKISNLISNNKNYESETLIKKSFRYIMLFGILISLGMIIISPKFIPLFYGKEFIPSIKLSILMSLYIPFNVCSNSIRWLYLIPYEKDDIYIKSTIYGAVINLILNLVLVNKYNVVGVIVATIISEVIALMHQIINIKKLKLWYNN